MKRFLHVGCGPKRKDETTPAFNTPEWEEVRFDIDETVAPDIVGTMLDMSSVPAASFDAIFSSHNLEHLNAHEVKPALEEFRRVLRKDGFVVITCPDLQTVCALVAQDKLLDPAYVAPAAGPITPLDIIYGHRASLMQGHWYMAHRCGFTQRVLNATLTQAGFGGVVSMRRERAFDLWAVATVEEMPDDELRALAIAHFPR